MSLLEYLISIIMDISLVMKVYYLEAVRHHILMHNLCHYKLTNLMLSPVVLLKLTAFNLAIFKKENLAIPNSTILL